MRDELVRARPADTHRHVESEPLRLFAFFGGTDAFGAAPDVTRAVVATGRPLTLRVVGATESIRAELAGLEPAPGQVVEVIEPTSSLADEVVAADLVVSAAGTSSWELLCLGAACAFLCVADNQQVSYDRITTLGVVAGLGRLEQVRERPRRRRTPPGGDCWTTPPSETGCGPRQDASWTGRDECASPTPCWGNGDSGPATPG